MPQLCVLLTTLCLDIDPIAVMTWLSIGLGVIILVIWPLI